jgi:hypothetical protein
MMYGLQWTLQTLSPEPCRWCKIILQQANIGLPSTDYGHCSIPLRRRRPGALAVNVQEIWS